MYKFDKHQIEDLKQWLHESNVRDSEIYVLEYDREERKLMIGLFNYIYGIGTNFFFDKVKLFLYVNGHNRDESENPKTVVSVAAENDYSCIRSCASIFDGKSNDSLCLSFLLTSGEQLYIVCDNISFDKSR